MNDSKDIRKALMALMQDAQTIAIKGSIPGHESPSTGEKPELAPLPDRLFEIIARLEASRQAVISHCSPGGTVMRDADLKAVTRIATYLGAAAETKMLMSLCNAVADLMLAKTSRMLLQLCLDAQPKLHGVTADDVMGRGGNIYLSAQAYVGHLSFLSSETSAPRIVEAFETEINAHNLRHGLPEGSMGDRFFGDLIGQWLLGLVPTSDMLSMLFAFYCWLANPHQLVGTIDSLRRFVQERQVNGNPTPPSLTIEDFRAAAKPYGIKILEADEPETDGYVAWGVDVAGCDSMRDEIIRMARAGETEDLEEIRLIETPEGALKH